jgi:hypothetical protein
MTVTGFKDGESSAICQWFHKNQQPQACAFELHALELYRPPLPATTTSHFSM